MFAAIHLHIIPVAANSIPCQMCSISISPDNDRLHELAILDERLNQECTLCHVAHLRAQCRRPAPNPILVSIEKYMTHVVFDTLTWLHPLTFSEIGIERLDEPNRPTFRVRAVMTAHNRYDRFARLIGMVEGYDRDIVV